MQKCCFNIYKACLQIPQQLGRENDSKAHIIHNRSKTLVEIDSRNLAVATSYQSSSEDPVSLDLEDPLALDCSSILRDVFFLHDFPNLLLLNLFKFFIDGFTPFLLRPCIIMIPSFFKSCRFPFNSSYIKERNVCMVE
jgi:hypothetical protein